ncbi:MAG: HEAT repeat domain-containing protein [Leptonema sp. (in: Bacteria)]|nr:HEAT repeat domain-containing protein [Leptonema sp. (in: bacteria)]
MRRLVVLTLLVTLFVPSISKAAGDDPARLIAMMDQGGLARRQAFWFSYQSKQFYLLRRAATYFFESNDYEDHRMLLRIMELLGPSLDTHLPGWYDILDRYMNPAVPDDILIRCMKLGVRFKEHRLVFAMTRMMEHPIYEVRMAAIESLVAMENDLVVPVLLRYLKCDDPVLILYGLQGAKVLGDTRFFAFVRDLLEHQNKSVRIYALRAIANIQGNGDTSYLITGRFSRETNPEVRRTIIQLIGSRKMSGQQYTVSRALHDSSPLVREAAYQTAAELRSSFFAREVSQRLNVETDTEMRKAGVLSLDTIRIDDSVAALSRLLLNDESIEIRCLAARAIGRLNDRSQNKALLSAVIHDNNKQVQKEAAVALLTTTDFNIVQPISDLILKNDVDLELRFLLFRAIEKNGSIDVLNQLKNRSASIQDPALRNVILHSMKGQ